MKFALSILLIALIAVLGAQASSAPQKAVVVSYPNDTPDSVLAAAKAAIKEAGGVITHEYNLIKAFAAKAPAKVLENVQAMGTEWHAIVEEDQMVNANGGGA